MGRELSRILVVDDDESWLRSSDRLLTEWGLKVTLAASVEDAIAALQASSFDAMLLDVNLGQDGGSGLTVARFAASMASAPITIVLSGAAARTETFELAQLGARIYLEKPVSPAVLKSAIEQVLLSPPNPHPVLRGVVGHVTLKDALRTARKVMAEQALGMAQGNRTNAAGLLGVTRQGLQQILRDRDS